MGLRKTYPLIDLDAQYLKIKREIDDAIDSVVQSKKFINGPEVQAFSQELSSFLDVNFVIPCANGTDALQIALMSLDLKPGDEVITTPFTFISTVEVITILNLRPVFVDIDPITYNINTNKIESSITEKTKCILPVHLFGQPADMKSILKLADKYELFVIEDNAQSIGAYCYDNEDNKIMAGTAGHFGTTSFYPSKNLSCFGDGGAIFTNDEELYNRAWTIANHGSTKKYYYESIGLNSRLDSIQAAVLRVKLRHLDDYNKKRKLAAAFYDELLEDSIKVLAPNIRAGNDHIYHQYTLRILDKRDEVSAKLKALGVSSAIYYPLCLHLQRAYQFLNYRNGDFKCAERASKEVLSIPMHTELTQSDQKDIIQQLEKVVNG